MNLIGLKRKEQALTLVNKLGAQTVKTQSEDVWMKIRVITEQCTKLHKGIELQNLLSDILTEGFIETSAAQTKYARQVEMLESKLASSFVDYEAQDKILCLEKQVEDQYSQLEDERLRWTGKIEELENTLRRTSTVTCKMESTNEQTSFKLNQSVQESKRLQNLLNKLATSMRGTQLERVIEQLATTTLTIARSDFNLQQSREDLDQIEVQLRNQGQLTYEQVQNLKK